MWWRVLGVALVLLVAGVAGGYAVADRTAEEPARSHDAWSPSRRFRRRFRPRPP